MSEQPTNARGKKKVTEAVTKPAQSLAEEVEFSLELKPADVRSHMLRGWAVLAEMAEDTTADKTVRFTAIDGMAKLYSTLVMKDGLEETLMRAGQFNQNQKNTLEEVKRLRQRPYDDAE